MNRFITLSVAVGLSISGLAFAGSGDMHGMDMPKDMPMDMHKGSMDKGETKAESHQATGIVKSVDPSKGTVTLSHEPVKSLKWPAMTMGFGVKDKALLDKLKEGQKVEVEFVKEGTKYLITSVK